MKNSTSKLLLIVVFLFVQTSFLKAQFNEIFSETIIDTRTLDENSYLYNIMSKFGDYDNDGDLDILALECIVTETDSSSFIYIYNNQNNIFIKNLELALIHKTGDYVDWFDYDNDGDLDIVFSGSIEAENVPITKIFQNTGNGFTEVFKYDLTPVMWGSMDFGDYDNDGDLDILLTGRKMIKIYEEYEHVTKIYQNTGNGFNEVFDIIGGAGQADWADFNNDGKLDILFSGIDTYFNNVSKLYFNTGSGFTEVYAGSIAASFYNSFACSDYDNDGDIDFLLGSKLYQNSGNGFSEVYNGTILGNPYSTAWGDYDNDGDLDVILSGSYIYRNDGNGFSEINIDILNSFSGRSCWGDYDNDEDLDFLNFDFDENKNIILRIFRNISEKPNIPAAAPANPNSTVSGANVILTWNKATDTETPQNGLSYNIFVYKDEPKSKSRKLVAKAEKIQYSATGYTLKNLANGTYYWKVQAFDTGLKGGDFSEEKSFTIGNIITNPEINVKGNLINILDGANTTSLLNHTDFGNVNISESLIRTFSIQNLGSANIILGAVSVSGNGFSVAQPLTSTLLPNASTTFNVIYTPINIGVSTGSVSIINNDSDENPYNFTIKGNGIDNGDLIITWNNPADIIYSTILGNTQLNATANKPGTFKYTPAIRTKLNAGLNQELTVEFTPTDLVNYSIVTKKVYINVLKANSSITWARPQDIYYGTPLSNTQLNAVFYMDGTWIYTPAIGTMLNAGFNQTLKVVFIPTDNLNYNTSSKTVLINVYKANSTITWNNPADIVYGTLLSTSQLNASADVSGLITYNPSVNTKLKAGTNQVLKATFTPNDQINYITTKKSVLINVLKVDPIINWENPSDILYGTALNETQLNASADVSGTFFYTPTNGTILEISQNQELKTDFTPSDETNYNNASKSVFLNIIAILGIEERNTNVISIYPNPTDGLITISNLDQFGKNEDLNISIQTIDGITVYQEKIPNEYDSQSIDVSLLSNGFYILRIQTTNNEALIRFVKN